MARYAAVVVLCLSTAAISSVADVSPDAIAGDELAAAQAAVRAHEAHRITVFARAAKAVVCIFSDNQGGGGGSGVIITPEGYGLTNFHVVQPFVESRRGFGGLSDGRLYPLRLLGIDPGGDIALFKLEGKECFEFVPLGDSDTLHVGEWVAAMGNPFMLAEDFSPTITLGVISGLHRYQHGQGNVLEYADCVQVSTSINPGNSGGPLLDLAGRVIGINGRASFQDEKNRQRVNVGLGYAVSVNQIKRFLPGLRAGRLLEHGTLGATVRAAGDELIVSTIQAYSPAETAGLRLGEELLEVAGRRVRTANDYNNVLATLPANWPVTLKLRRDGHPFETIARLESLPLRTRLVYVVDLEHNHAELARILDRHAGHAHMRVEQPFLHVTFRGRLRSNGRAGDQPLSLIVQSPRAPGVSSAPANDGPGFALREEWRALTLALLVRPEVDLEWELLAGDEVNGCIVNVVERRLDADRRVRWKFDWRTDELLEVTIDERAPDASGQTTAVAVWSPSAPRDFGGLWWPPTWARRTPAGDEMVLEIHSIEIAPVSAGESPAPGPSAEADK